MKTEKFDVTLPPARIDQLRQRLAATNWPDVVGEDDWQYGVPRAWMQDMVDYWLNEWSWTKAQEEMNRFTHFRVVIDGIPIHCLHAPATDSDAPALVLTHGWPWTFWDFRYVIEPLSQHYNVYVPSLPGFGFSMPLTQSGVDVKRTAQLWVQLMTDVLGYQRFFAHGGDWGALITAQLAHAHADKVAGAHLALTLIPGINRSELGPEAFAADEAWMIERNAESQLHITSHVTVHRIDPQTLGYALVDSPIGTAAWIWERRRNWSDCDGDPLNAFSREHLCTTAALFWCTGAISSSLRIYYEHFNKPWPLEHRRKPVLEAPTGFAVFPRDVVHIPRRLLEENCNLRRYTIMPRGGHFGAAEVPDDLVPEMLRFFGALD